jgi:AcrR family transcriptional regulator
MARPASDIRARICAAARRRFLEDGVDGASLRRIAKDAKTSIGMVYYYFKTKDDLFLAVVEESYAKLVAEWARDLSADTSPAEKLRGVFSRMARLSDVELDTVRLVMREALVSSARLVRLAQRFEQGHVPLVLKTLRDGIAAGDFDPELDLAVLLSATASLAIFPQVLHRQISTASLPVARMLPTREDAAEQLVGVLLGGIARR